VRPHDVVAGIARAARVVTSRPVFVQRKERSRIFQHIRDEVLTTTSARTTSLMR
jgi:hypothetical protein